MGGPTWGQSWEGGRSHEPGKPPASRTFCLSPDSHRWLVSLPGGIQPTQSDGLTAQGPHPKPSGILAGHAVPFLWRFLADGCRAWSTIFSVLDVLWGLKGVKLQVLHPNPLMFLPSQEPEGSPRTQ